MGTPPLIVVAALTRRGVIGAADGLPWRIPEEYQHFLDLIRGQTLIMGRRSWQIFGPNLATDHNLVLSRTVRELQGAEVVVSVDEALARAADLGRTVFSAGGAAVYAETIPLADAMYLSWIKGEYDGDVLFPDFDPSRWRVARREDHHEFEFVVYCRR